MNRFLVFVTKLFNASNKLIFLLIPILFLLTGIYFQGALGFHFLGSHIDPDYAYLFNSLAITQSLPIGHTDHPGTPMQILGSIVIRVAHTLRGQHNLVNDVLKNPEIYIDLILKTALVLNSILLLVTGIIVFKVTKKILPALLLQLTPFLSPSLIYSPLLGLSAEPLLLFSGILFLLPIFLIFFGAFKKYPAITILFCIALGLGIATKIIFAPLILVPLFVLPSFKQRVALIFGTIISFYFFTQPIISQYSRLFTWMNDLLTHSGRHGTGEKAIIDQTMFLVSIKRIFTDQYIIGILLIIASLIIIIYGFKYGITKPFKQNLAFRLLIGLFVAEVVQILMVAKHPGGQYLIPGILLTPAFIVTLTFLIYKFSHPHRQMTGGFSYNSKLGSKSFLFTKNLGIFLISLILFFQLYTTTSKIPVLHKALEEQKNDDKAIYDEIQSKYRDNIIITYFRSSSPFYALRFGNTFANFSFNRNLKSVYPSAYFWDIWNNVYTDWDSQVTFPDIIKKSGGKDIIFYGTSFESSYKDSPQYKPPLPLKIISSNRSETIYKVDLSILGKKE